MSKLLRLSEQRAYISERLGYAFLSVGVGVAAIQIGIHTLFLEKYAEIFQLQQHGFPAEVPEEFKTTLSEVSDDLGIPIKNPVTKLLAVIGFDCMHFGSVLARSGCFIGIPVNFFYKSKSDIDHPSILIEQKQVPWFSRDGKKLEESLLLSDSAKKFGIAYELACSDTPRLFLHTLSAPFSLIICAQLNNYFCNVFGLPHRPATIKGGFYSLLIVFGVGVYLSFKDLASQYCELSAHDKVCEGGEDYIKGGIEYYEKLLERNKALRNLLHNGKSYFNSNGDPIYLLRKKHVPLTVLKSLCDQKLKQNQVNVTLSETL